MTARSPLEALVSRRELGPLAWKNSKLHLGLGKCVGECLVPGIVNCVGWTGEEEESFGGSFNPDINEMRWRDRRLDGPGRQPTGMRVSARGNASCDSPDLHGG